MKNKTNNLIILGELLKPDQIRDSILTYLNWAYRAKAHLYERLPKFSERANFKHLKNAILEIGVDRGKQIARVEDIYVLMDEEPSLTNCDKLIEFAENTFIPMLEKSTGPRLRDLSILYYLSIIESTKLASFQLLQMGALNFLTNKLNGYCKGILMSQKLIGFYFFTLPMSILISYGLCLE